MADAQTKIVLTADDRTKAAFASATNSLKSMTRSADTLRASMAGIAGGLGVGAFVAFAKNTLDMADAMNDLSDRTGVTVKDLASLRRVAEESDTSLEGLSKGLQKITLSIGEAERGNQSYANALKNLGVTAKDPLQALYQIADAVEATNDPTRIAADLQQVLTKNYVELLPLLKQGSEELKKSAKESESFADAIARLAPEAGKLNNELARLKEEAAGGAAVLLTDMVPVMKATLVGALGLSEAFYQVGSSIGATAAAVSAAASGEFKEAAQIMAALFDDLDARQAAFGRRFDAIMAEAKATAGAAGKAGGSASIYFPPPKLKGVTGAAAKDNPLVDVLGSGSFFATDPETIKFIREQQEAYNALNAIIPETTRRLQEMIAAADFSELARAQEDMILLAKAFNEGIVDAEGNLRKLSESEYLDIVKNRLGLVGEEAEKTKTFAQELGLTLESALGEAIRSGGDASDVFKALLKDIVQLIAQMYVLKPLMESLKVGGSSTSSSGVSLDLGGLFSEGFGNGQNLLGDFASLFGFANGGIMTGNGPLPLQKYAFGGVANTPQLALFGEGSTPEAYVPLPDGRRIPVRMEGGGRVINQTVNITAKDPTEVRLSRGAQVAEVSRALQHMNRWT